MNQSSILQGDSAVHRSTACYTGFRGGEREGGRTSASRPSLKHQEVRKRRIRTWTLEAKRRRGCTEPAQAASSSFAKGAALGEAPGRAGRPSHQCGQSSWNGSTGEPAMQRVRCAGGSNRPAAGHKPAPVADDAGRRHAPSSGHSTDCVAVGQ